VENFLAGLGLVLTPLTFLTIFLGVAFGLFVGAVPGIGSILGIVVVLPFVCPMDQAPGIALLLAIYCAGTYAACISAILINIPGTANSAPTCFDGFPMTKRGEGGLALGWATVASVFGGLLSLFILTLAAPQLAAIALKFGPIETAALLFFALVCIIVVSSAGNIARGAVSAAIGLFLASVGVDPISGQVRFTFDIFILTSGFDMIAVLVGVFALSEIFMRIAGPDAGYELVGKGAGFRLPRLRDFVGRLPRLVRGALIGTFVGVLPGAGAAPAAFISYTDAQRSSPRREGLGKGEPDGIIATESANNACTGGALIPTLSLGIPGDATTALMMATLIIQGVAPGVRLFTESADLVYAIFIILMIVNVLMGIMGVVACYGFMRVVAIPQAFLFSGVTILSMLGIYAIRGNVFDLVTLVGAGIVGFLMRLNNFPVVPVVIGLILGSEFERHLRGGLILTDGSILAFAQRPLAVALFALSVLMIAFPLVRHVRALLSTRRGRPAQAGS